jgi:polynucleotide 5'-hydroxyl-kinase GRC3/NOL9
MTAFAAAAQQRAQDSDPRYESDDDDYEETDEPSVASPTASFCAPLTTWTESSTNVSSATPERLTIVLKKHEIVVQIGVYDLYVEEGAIAINGALIRAKHQPLRIFAPATHSLPAVEALSHAVVRFTSCSSFSMQTLERLSPLYAKIWNAKKEEPYQRSFAMVSDVLNQ